MFDQRGGYGSNFDSSTTYTQGTCSQLREMNNIHKTDMPEHRTSPWPSHDHIKAVQFMFKDTSMDQKALVAEWTYLKVGYKLCGNQHRCLPVRQTWFAPAPLAVLDTFLYPCER